MLILTISKLLISDIIVRSYNRYSNCWIHRHRHRPGDVFSICHVALQLQTFVTNGENVCGLCIKVKGNRLNIYYNCWLWCFWSTVC